MMTPIIEFDRTCFNPDYIPFHSDDSRVRIVYGGRDSAKSHEIALRFLIEFMSLDYCKIILFRKVFRDIRVSQFAQLLDLIDQFEFTDMFEVNQNRLEIRYKHRPNSLIMARGLDIADKTKSLKDPTHAWFEEANQITEDDYITASLGLRSSKIERTKEVLSFNPDKECWIENYFFPEKETYERPDGKFMFVPSTKKDVSIYHMGYWNNTFISEERIDKLNYLKERSPDKFRVNALGLWGRGLEGQVFENYNVVDSIPNNADCYFGVDYGFNNPSAVVEIGRFENNIYWDELLYQKGLTQSDLAESIIKLRERIGHTPVVVDSANASLVEELRRAKFN
ncbi:PBSX family phage terminase large subunit, partial [Candidatus Dojkabacteria bacterium]|nr:PBSX family phage terminase large subunit [Candidatus Dojkabacteria bacterium]